MQRRVARSAIPPARAPSEWLFGLLCRLCWRAAFADASGTFPCLDARLGSHRAVPEAKGLIARLHDVAMVGQPVQQRRRHLGVAKYCRPLRETQVGGNHHAGVLVQLGQQMKQQGTACLAEGQIGVAVENGI